MATKNQVKDWKKWKKILTSLKKSWHLRSLCTVIWDFDILYYLAMLCFAISYSVNYLLEWAVPNCRSKYTTLGTQLSFIWLRFNRPTYPLCSSVWFQELLPVLLWNIWKAMSQLHVLKFSRFWSIFQLTLCQRQPQHCTSDLKMTSLKMRQI